MPKTNSSKKKQEQTEFDSLLKAVGEKLKLLRKKAGYSNYENFAFDNDMNRVSYGRIESGANITLKSLLRVLKIHGITLEDFFKGIK